MIGAYYADVNPTLMCDKQSDINYVDTACFIVCNHVSSLHSNRTCFKVHLIKLGMSWTGPNDFKSLSYSIK